MQQKRILTIFGDSVAFGDVRVWGDAGRFLIWYPDMVVDVASCEGSVNWLAIIMIDGTPQREQKHRENNPAVLRAWSIHTCPLQYQGHLKSTVARTTAG